MLTFEKMKKKIDYYKEPKLLILAIKLPTGAIETITNYNNISSKIDYIINAYDENLCLKSCTDIKILDMILL